MTPIAWPALFRTLSHFRGAPRLLGTVHGGETFILSHRPDPDNRPGMFVWWTLSDNCTEFNLTRINSGELQSVPYTADTITLDNGTLAYRIAQVLHGEPIDYDYREDPELTAMLEATKP